MFRIIIDKDSVNNGVPRQEALFETGILSGKRDLNYFFSFPQFKSRGAADGRLG